MFAKAGLLLFAAARFAEADPTCGVGECCFSHPSCSTECPGYGEPTRLGEEVRVFTRSPPNPAVCGDCEDAADPFTGEKTKFCWDKALEEKARLSAQPCAPLQGQAQPQPCDCSEVAENQVEDFKNKPQFVCHDDVANQHCKGGTPNDGCRLAQCKRTLVLQAGSTPFDVICLEWTDSVSFPSRGRAETVQRKWYGCPSGYTSYGGECRDETRHIGEPCWASGGTFGHNAGQCKGHGEIDSLSCYKTDDDEAMHCVPTVRLFRPVGVHKQACECWTSLAFGNTCAAADGECGGHSCTNKAVLPLPSSATFARQCDWLSAETGSDEWPAARRSEQHSGDEASDAGAATAAAVAAGVAASGFALLCFAAGIRRRQQQQAAVSDEEEEFSHTDYSSKPIDC